MNSYQQDTGYHMGVFLCYGQPIHSVSLTQAVPCTKFNSFKEIHEYVCVHSKILLFLGDGHHLTKKKAEQNACENAINSLSKFNV